LFFAFEEYGSHESVLKIKGWHNHPEYEMKDNAAQEFMRRRAIFILH